ncbi:hypothetical protein GFM14_34215 [Rhizobium leguminosarum bv. viciae]|nr:hypothetical protein [Rhizobium leguminosarum bv. viciae]
MPGAKLKYVREGHVQTETHWMKAELIPNVSDKLTPSGVSSVGRCIADRRFTNCELLCLRLALELETSI